MQFDEPGWWYATPLDWRTRALAPFGRLYGLVAELRFRRRQPYRSRLPVICVGNLTAGGTGKTPLALLMAEYLVSRGEIPVFLTRGHGGRTAGPRWVDPLADSARAVGDEALLLARVAPSLIARDRKAGARAIERAGGRATVIVMDDGLQNPGLKKDLVIAVVDGTRGIGNGHVIPAGPLRAPLDFQLDLVHVVVVNGPPGRTDRGGASEIHRHLTRGFGGPVLAAEAIACGDAGWLADTSVVAYAGIGHPQRFFDMLGVLGARVVVARPFPDHHVFAERDARELLGLAQTHGAALVTTEKDLARLTNARGERAVLRDRSRALPIRLVFTDHDASQLAALVDNAVETGGYRRGASQR